VAKRKDKIPKLPTGSRPIGPLPTGSNVIPFPGNPVCLLDELNRRDVETKVIYVDFQNRVKIGHVS